MNKKRHKLADGRYLYEVTPVRFLLQNQFQHAIIELTVESVVLSSTIESEAIQCPSTQESPQVP